MVKILTNLNYLSDSKIFCKHHNHTIMNIFCKIIFPKQSFVQYIFAFSSIATRAPSSGKFLQLCPVDWDKDFYNYDKVGDDGDDIDVDNDDVIIMMMMSS